jgi:transposase-like protein
VSEGRGLVCGWTYAVPMSGDSSEGKPFVIVADARRRWTCPEKQAMVAQCGVDRALVSAVARKHNLATSPLFRWRRELRPARAAEAKPAFVPVALPAPVGTPGLLDRTDARPMPMPASIGSTTWRASPGQSSRRRAGPMRGASSSTWRGSPRRRSLSTRSPASMLARPTEDALPSCTLPVVRRTLPFGHRYSFFCLLNVKALRENVP